MIAADLILPAGADRTDRERWRTARQAGIGASDVSAILGMSKRKTAREVYWEKVGPLADDEISEAGRWGTLLEPVVREEWTHRTGIAVTPTGLHRSRTHDFMLCSPDGLTADGGLYEGKTASEWKRDEWGEDQIPDHAELQVQHGMAVMGLGHAWVVGLIGGQKLVWRRIERDDELIEMIIKAEREFWHEHVLPRVPPPVDGSEASTTWLAEQYPLAEPDKVVEVSAETAQLIRQTYKVAAAHKKTDETNYKAAQNMIRDLMGDAEVIRCGEQVIATWTNNGSAFDEAAFRADHPDLAAKYTTSVEVIDRKALAKAEPAVFSRYRNRVLRVK